MSLKCLECGVVHWGGMTSCGSCGAALSVYSSSGLYTERETEHGKGFSRHFRIGPFFKALLYSIAAEVLVLALTFKAIGGSMMRHSSAAPGSSMGDALLAYAGFIFHLPSILIVTPLGLFIFAPLVQVALMTGVLYLIFRCKRQVTVRSRALR